MPDTTFYIHSTHKRSSDPMSNCIVVKEKVKHVNEDSTVTWKDKLRFFVNPTRSFYITAPRFRNHKYKKEFEDIDKLEMHRCKDNELSYQVALALSENGYANRYARLRELCDSPYTYGCDIETEVLVKQAYLKKIPPGEIPHYTVGAFDIENEVRGEGAINVITFIHEHEVYTCALERYCRIYHKETDTFELASKEQCLKVIYDTIGDELKKHDFHLHFEIKAQELDMIKWIFDRIHECKTDFIGIWNIHHDIPKILSRIDALGGDAAAIMCHPDVPEHLRYCKFHEDMSTVDHITDKWHWMNLTGYSQFVDSMCLYARLRKVYGRDSSYSLDDISTKELGQGKLHFGKITNHYQSQNYDFLRYIAYNINDVLIMMLMEWKNHDIDALCGLSGVSLISQFNRQTVLARNDQYLYGLSRGKMPASTGANMYTEFDRMLPKVGGTVLPPNKAAGVSIAAVSGINSGTQVCIAVNDLDVSSMYPSIQSAFNISKETLLTSVIGINGFSVNHLEMLGSGLNSPDTGSVQICCQLLGYMDYNEMLDAFEQKNI